VLSWRIQYCVFGSQVPPFLHSPCQMLDEDNSTTGSIVTTSELWWAYFMMNRCFHFQIGGCGQRLFQQFGRIIHMFSHKHESFNKERARWLVHECRSTALKCFALWFWLSLSSPLNILQAAVGPFINKSMAQILFHLWWIGVYRPCGSFGQVDEVKSTNVWPCWLSP